MYYQQTLQDNRRAVGRSSELIMSGKIATILVRLRLFRAWERVFLVLCVRLQPTKAYFMAKTSLAFWLNDDGNRASSIAVGLVVTNIVRQRKQNPREATEKVAGSICRHHEILGKWYVFRPIEGLGEKLARFGKDVRHFTRQPFMPLQVLDD